MAKKKTAQVTHLSPNKTKVLKAISRQLKLNFEDAAIIGAEAHIPTIRSIADVTKLCRKMKREKLLTYKWTAEGERVVAITRKAVKLMKVA